MMADGDEKIVAQRIAPAAVEPRAPKTAEPAAPPAADDLRTMGRRDHLQRGQDGSHTLHLQQRGDRLEGLHQGDFLTRDITGTINGDTVTLASVVTERHGDALDLPLQGQGDRRHHCRDRSTWESILPRPGRRGGDRARLKHVDFRLQLPAPKESRSCIWVKSLSPWPSGRASTPMVRSILLAAGS